MQLPSVSNKIRKMDARIGTVLNRLESDLRARWRTSAMAQLVGLSVSRFHQMFRRDTGISPARYLRRARIQRATDLLSRSTLSIKEVAAAVGMTQVQLSREFRAATGLSPSEYRSAAARNGATMCSINRKKR